MDGWLSNTEEEVLGVGTGQGEQVLADAITIYGRKQWTCKFCSETNVWTRWRCRRSGTTSLRVCKANTSKRCMRRVENGTLAHRPRVGEKSGSLEVACESWAAQQTVRDREES